MLKRILYFSLLLICPTFSFAGAYFGPGIIYLHNRADNVNYDGVSPTLYAGYGDWLQDGFSLAAEVFISSKSIEIGRNHSDELTLKNGVVYGLSIIPGMNLDSALFAYLRLGYLRAKFSSVDVQEGAYQIGIGAETALVGCWKVRLEYDYIPYRSVADIGTIQSNQVALSIIYRMDSSVD